MARCTSIKRGRERCKGVAVRGSTLCAAHHPDYQERRRAGARRGGKARGVGELAEIKSEIRAIIGAVIGGRISRSVGGVAFQGYNTLLRAVEVERKVRELDDLEGRLETLEQRIREAGRAG